VSNAELAGRISRVAGRVVTYVDIPESAQRDSLLGMGMTEWQVEALLDLQRYYTGGQGGEVDDVLAKFLGREPIGLDRFLEEIQVLQVHEFIEVIPHEPPHLRQRHAGLRIHGGKLVAKLSGMSTSRRSLWTTGRTCRRECRPVPRARRLMSGARIRNSSASPWRFSI
jgi:hypothetical protein